MYILKVFSCCLFILYTKQNTIPTYLLISVPFLQKHKTLMHIHTLVFISVSVLREEFVAATLNIITNLLQ